MDRSLLAAAAALCLALPLAAQAGTSTPHVCAVASGSSPPTPLDIFFPFPVAFPTHSVMPDPCTAPSELGFESSTTPCSPATTSPYSPAWPPGGSQAEYCELWYAPGSTVTVTSEAGYSMPVPPSFFHHLVAGFDVDGDGELGTGEPVCYVLATPSGPFTVSGTLSCTYPLDPPLLDLPDPLPDVENPLAPQPDARLIVWVDCSEDSLVGLSSIGVGVA